MSPSLSAHPARHEVDRMGKRPSYLSSTTLSTDNDGLVDWLNQALDIPVRLLTHSEDVGLQCLKHQGVKGHVRECMSSRNADPMMAEMGSLPTAVPRGFLKKNVLDVTVLGPTVGPPWWLYPLIFSQSGSRASLKYFIPFYLKSLILFYIILLLYFAVCKEFLSSYCLRSLY